MRMVCLAAAALMAASTAAAQTRINVQSYALGVDVPEPAALVTLGIGPPTRLGSAPKPAAFSLQLARIGGSAVEAVALDVTPYFLLGGGVRSLTSYRSMSVGGRLLRVLTKTIVSFGAAYAGDDPRALALGLAIRSTFHDPHDPIAGTALPEEIAATFAAAGVAAPGAEHESAADRGVDLDPVFARARRMARARSGDVQVSGGWGVSARAAGATLSADSIGPARQSGWIAAQYTFGPRYDVIGTAEVRDVFDSRSRFVGGLALRRKGTANDVQVGARYDARAEVLHPAIVLDARLAGRLGALVWIDTDADAGRNGADRRLRLGVLTRWFAAADPTPR
jgi:hypothetical protein